MTYSTKNYTTGIYPCYKHIVNEVLPKYENNEIFNGDINIKNIGASIRAFMYALDKDIPNIDADVNKTLDIIYNNLIDYINGILTTGRATGGSVTGGVTNTSVLDAYNAANVEQLNALNTKQPFSVLDTKQLTYVEPVLTNVEPAKYTIDAVVDKIKQPVVEVVNNTYTILPAAGADRTIAEIHADIRARLSAIDYATAIKEHFMTYKLERISSVEAIKKNNKIITTSADSVNGAALIRPQLLLALVKKISMDILQPDILRANVYSTINFYLVHNNTVGITLKEYDDMIQMLGSLGDDKYLYFLRAIRQELQHGSAFPPDANDESQSTPIFSYCIIS